MTFWFWLLSLVLPLPLSLALSLPVWAVAPAPIQVDHYLCAGDPLFAEVLAGAVDAPDIPNSLAGTVPGAFVVLQWRGVILQLPRTNNAGVPSFTDGRWWWRAVDPDQPEFRQRRGAIENYDCRRESPEKLAAAGD
jgi:hypothetical protein